jgi:hypothetical protein
LLEDFLADVGDREARKWQSLATRQLTSECLYLNDETGGKAGLAPASGFVLEARQTGHGESLAPLTDDLAGRVESRGDYIVGKTFGGEEDDLGANYIAIR